MPVDLSKLQIARFQDIPCGYFEDRITSPHGMFADWMVNEDENYPLKELYSILLINGYRRNTNCFYNQQCKNCGECIPIRVPVKDFKPSKSQKTNYRKNSDLEVRLVKGESKWENVNPDLFFDPMDINQENMIVNEKTSTTIQKFASDEKAIIFRKYSAHTHGTKTSVEEARRRLLLMHIGYTGVFDMEYYLGDRLVAVGLMDVAEYEDGNIYALSSNYFYYDTDDELLKRSLGVFSVLKEIELCRQLGCEHYYLGLYLPNCRKMNYKINYKPYELLINDSWLPGDMVTLQKKDEVSESQEKTEDTGSEDQIDLDKIQKIELPPADDEFNNDICLVTKDIPLQLLYSAYMQGVFPWFNEDEQQPVVWYSPDPRFVIDPNNIHISKSISKFLKKSPYTYTMDKAFEQVMRECRNMKRDDHGTWIGEKMIKAYTKFHQAGYAHSFEVWHKEKLVGGFYGVLIGSVFCGESMFTLEPDSSKSAFVLFAKAFKECGGKLIDCQCYTDNMARYGGFEIERELFLQTEQVLLRNPLKADLTETFNKIVQEYPVKEISEKS